MLCRPPELVQVCDCMPGLLTGTVTLLFTDIEGSTRLLEELGERYPDVLAEHRRVLRTAFGRRGGVEVDTQGDAFFVVFARADEAVTAAVEAQEALADGPVRVRIGLHTGEPVRTEEGYVGVDVHRAARICAAAHGGQVVLSQRTRLLAGGLGGFRDLGLHRLKDLAEPEKLFQFGEGDFPPLRSLNVTNLPVQPSALVGRDRELAELVPLVRKHRLVTLTGAGGSGKTRLAIEVASELTEEFLDGVFWVSLAGLADGEVLGASVAQSVGAKNGLAEHLAGKRTLLLLDNFEQLLAAAVTLSELLERCPDLHLLVTSRAVLRLAGEREYEVAPLSEENAVTLFRERARESEPLSAVVEICRRVDCLPLAIELAAARTRVFPPNELLLRLEQRLPLLTGGRRDAPARHQTLHATIDWSYSLLEAEEQRLFARQAVFAGEFTLEDAEDVCGASPDALGSLVEQSLLRRERDRFMMLATVREFAAERLSAIGEMDNTHARLAERLLDRSADAELGVPEYQSDDDNWRTATAWALERGDPGTLATLIVRAGAWRINVGETVHWTIRALSERHDLSPLSQARLLHEASRFQNLMGRSAEAVEAGRRALALYRKDGTEKDISSMLVALGQAIASTGELDEAERLFRECIELTMQSGDTGDRLTALHSLGELERDRGRLAEARPLLEKALELARAHGHQPTYILHGLGDLALETGDIAAARQAYAESLTLSRSLFAPYTLAHCLGGFAALAADQGLADEAGLLWGAVETYQADNDVRLGPREYSRYTRRLRKLDAKVFDAAVEHGRGLTAEEAIKRALALAN
jgi:predicted ATPase/class 3 adenylate cyclase